MENDRAVAVRSDNGEIVGTDFGMQAVVSVDQAIGRIKELQKFVHAVMVKGEDYGVIPGMSNKPSLFKPGAEKLCEMYGLTPTFAVVTSEKDWNNAFVYFEVQCSLVSKRSGLVAAEGLGSCNSRETRYKGRDVFTLANTILKMAKKRAHVDATLSATRSSGLFTQDVEDLAESHDGAPERSVPPKPVRKSSRGELVAGWAKLGEKARALQMQVQMIDESWTDQVLIDKARQWRDQIAAREHELATTDATETTAPGEAS